MTGLPQDFIAKKAPPVQYSSIEERLAAERRTDASRYQEAARLNMSQHLKTGGYPSTQRLACEQYAYARYLMGIDDYWLSLPRTIHPRVAR